MKRKFTHRQMAIIGLIADKKSCGAEFVTLDEIVEVVNSAGENSGRNALVICMKALIVRLNATGIFIELEKNIGRGRRQRYRLKPSIEQRLAV